MSKANLQVQPPDLSVTKYELFILKGERMLKKKHPSILSKSFLLKHVEMNEISFFQI